MIKYSKIEVNKDKSFNMPSLIGRRLTVYDVVSGLCSDGFESYVEDFSIENEQVIQALKYCKNQVCKEEESINFCDGCLLRGIQEEKFNEGKHKEFELGDDVITISKDNKVVFLGDKTKLHDEHLGKLGWVMAEEIYNEFILGK